MTPEDWERVIGAYNLIYIGEAERVEGETWRVYRINDYIRVDIRKAAAT